MLLFTTRIELHDANYFDYEKLHEAMKQNGFSRSITSSEGVTYHLPEAEYNSSGISSASVRDKACIAARTTGKRFAALVTGSDGVRAWQGLDLVK